MKWYLVKPVDKTSTFAYYGELAGLTTILNDGSSRPTVAGDVVSCNTDGKLLGRPPGTDGDWELVGLNGGCAAFNPTKKRAFVYGYQASVPGGFGAISQEPLA